MADCRRISMDRWRSQISALLLILEVFSTTELIDAQNAPLNAAANVGDRVVINCTTGDSVFPGWKYSQTGLIGSYTSISYIGSCNSLISSRFVVESTGNGSCNLIIPSATTAEALAYQCDDGRAFNHAMLLTIIESIEVSPNSAAQELCPGDPMNITCSVRYSAVSTPGLQMFPSIMWTNLSANANVNGTDLNSSNVTTSYLSIIATLPTVPSYSCNVYFNAPILPPGLAMNAPNYNKSTNTAQVPVQYNILNLSSINVTSHNESGICEAKILKCNPYAYPSPHDVHWFDVFRKEAGPLNKTLITGEFGGEYVCSVTNIIKGNNYTASAIYKLNNDSGFTMDSCYGPWIVNITVSGKNPSDKYKAKSSNKINLHSSENAYEITIENATEVIITCIADGLPNPSYIWNDPCNTTASHQEIIAKASGSYECEASNSINDRIFRKSATINANLPSAGPLKCECAPGFSTCEECDSTDAIILGVFLGLSLLLNFASVGWILLHFTRKKNSPKETSSRPVEYANISSDNPKATNQSPTGPYEELHRDSNPPTAVVYEELSKNNEQRSAQ